MLHIQKCWCASFFDGTEAEETVAAHRRKRRHSHRPHQRRRSNGQENQARNLRHHADRQQHRRLRTAFLQQRRNREPAHTDPRQSHRTAQEAVKHFYRDGDSVTLVSSNTKYKPMVYHKGDCDEFRILGKAVAYLHDLE